MLGTTKPLRLYAPLTIDGAALTCPTCGAGVATLVRDGNTLSCRRGHSWTHEQIDATTVAAIRQAKPGQVSLALPDGGTLATSTTGAKKQAKQEKKAQAKAAKKAPPARGQAGGIARSKHAGSNGGGGGSGAVAAGFGTITAALGTVTAVANAAGQGLAAAGQVASAAGAGAGAVGEIAKTARPLAELPGTALQSATTAYTVGHRGAAGGIAAAKTAPAARGGISRTRAAAKPTPAPLPSAVTFTSTRRQRRAAR